MNLLARPVVELRPNAEARLGPFVSSVDGSQPPLATCARLRWQCEQLVVEFEAEESSPWGTYRERDSPLWQEEAVELFIAPGAEPPMRYFEIQVSPLGTIFDAIVWNPRGDRTLFEVDPVWNCPGLDVAVKVEPDRSRWIAQIAVPWSAFLDAGLRTPSLWSLNLFRIARPRPGSSGPTVFASWSPTGIEPADFHRPARFGILRLLV